MEPNETSSGSREQEPVGEPEALSPVATISDSTENSAPFPAPKPPREGEPTFSPQRPSKPGLNYLDLLYLALFSVPSFIVSMLIGVVVFFGLNFSAGWELTTEDVGAKASIVVAIQLLWWVMVLGFIYALITVRHRLPFRETIAWRPLQGNPNLRGAWYCLLGFLLAFSVAFVAWLIPMPEEKLPIEELLRDRSSLILVAIFGVAVAPIAEELVFRGFAFAVFQRAHGALAAIVMTSGVFSLIHGQQYGWHWQNLLLLFYVGIVFGAVRARTNSVIPGTIIHAAYNTTLLAGLLSAGETIERL